MAKTEHNVSKQHFKAEKFGSGVNRRAAAHMQVWLHGISWRFSAQREHVFTVSKTVNLSSFLLLLSSSHWRTNLMTCLVHRLQSTPSISTVRMAHARRTSNKY